jgi:hypothetical protein
MRPLSPEGSLSDFWRRLLHDFEQGIGPDRRTGNWKFYLTVDHFDVSTPDRELKMGIDKNQELSAFIESWEETPEKNRGVFLHLVELLSNKKGVTLEFVPRPGVTYSLRAVHPSQKKRGLFVIADVIEETPRWLSVCFYSDMITDPEERGIFVPEGILGEDAVCFDIEERDEEFIRYIETRVDEAWLSAPDQ